MAIFRGPGGAGNATTDSEITLLTQLEQSASQSASSASTSATNAATSASQAATSATNAANSASSASTSASNAADSATAAATSASNAATSASNAATSESNAASSASAALTSENNAATSEANAATSESNAATSESNAASSASSASTSASNAATSETNAANSASAASTSATNAASSASAAATSASNAATSESNAAASAAAAATFDPALYLTKDNPSYTGTLTGGTGVVNLGSGQFVKDESGNVGIGRATASEQLHVAGNIRTDSQFHAEATDTAAAPGYTWRSDTDTGIFRATVDAIGFSTNGTERMRITSAGKILAAAGTNWVGTVSQNGQSSVIERGSNANGEFVKFADGTMICTVERTESRSTTGIVTTSITLPASYVSGADYVLISNSRTTVPDVVSAIGFIRNTPSTATMYISRSTTTNTAVSIVAIGRWY